MTGDENTKVSVVMVIFSMIIVKVLMLYKTIRRKKCSANIVNSTSACRVFDGVID